MPSRYRLYRLAVRGGLIVSVLFGIAGFAFALGVLARDPSQALIALYQERLQQPQQDPNAGKHNEEARNERDAIFWRGADGTPETYETVCEKPKHHDDADLCQQWRTAQYARNQIGIGIFTLLGLGVTVLLASINLVLSRKATLAATEAAKAARDAVVTADTTARRELRAYVNLEIKSREWPPGEPDRHDIFLQISNEGQTWARRAMIEKHVVHLRKGSARDPFEAAPWAKQETPPTLIGPRQKISAQYEVITYEHAKILADSDDVVYFVARVRYRDAIDGKSLWQTQVSRKLNTDSEGGISFTHMDTHNCADEDCPADPAPSS